MISCAHSKRLSVKDDHGANRRGVIIVLTAIVLTIMLGFVAMTTDIGLITLVRTRLQSTADASAYAAALNLGSTTSSADDMITQAREIALLNFYGGSNQPTGGQILADSDVTIGTWDASNRTFTPGGTVASANAVKVVSRQSAASGNALKLLFGPLLGKSAVDIASTAIVMTKDATDAGNCFEKGILCGNSLQVNADAIFDNICCYGRRRVECGCNCDFLNTSKLGSLPTSVIQYSAGGGLPGAIIRADKQPTLAQNCSQLIDNIQNAVGLPSKITTVKILSSWPPSSGIQPNTAYVVNSSVDITENTTCNFKNNIIACRGTIHFGQKCKINNSGSASAGDCNTLLIASGDVQMGQDATVNMVEYVAGHDVQLNQAATVATMGYCQAVNDVQLNQKANMKNSTLKSVYGSTTAKKTLALVQ